MAGRGSQPSGSKPTPPKKPIHVAPSPNEPGKWEVKREGAQRATALTDTQAAAQDIARAQAKKDKTEMITHGRDGRIREKDSFGNDPYPPEG